MNDISAISTKSDVTIRGTTQSSTLSTAMLSDCNLCTIVYTLHTEDDMMLVESLLPQHSCDSFLPTHSLCVTPNMSRDVANMIQKTYRSGNGLSSSQESLGSEKSDGLYKDFYILL